MKKARLITTAAALMLLTTTGCTEAARVSGNLKYEADAFNVSRRITVLNMRSDKVLLQMEGVMSIRTNDKNELEVIVEIEQGKYMKHMIYLNEWTMYIVEAIGGSEVSRSAYEIHFLPEVINSGLIDLKVDK